MFMPTKSRRRNAAHVPECAISCSIVCLLLFGLIIGGLGVFRYQEVASLARDGSRYASLHGDQYQKGTGKAAATASDVHQNAILPNAIALDSSQLTSTVNWNPDNKAGSTVTVTVSYHWIPEAFLPSMNLSSTSTAVVLY
jgi:Flp pilus assembly protein TadG